MLPPPPPPHSPPQDKKDGPPSKPTTTIARRFAPLTAIAESFTKRSTRVTARRSIRERFRGGPPATNPASNTNVSNPVLNTAILNGIPLTNELLENAAAVALTGSQTHRIIASASNIIAGGGVIDGDTATGNVQPSSSSSPKPSEPIEKSAAATNPALPRTPPPRTTTLDGVRRPPNPLGSNPVHQPPRRRHPGHHTLPHQDNHHVGTGLRGTDLLTTHRAAQLGTGRETIVMDQRQRQRLATTHEESNEESKEESNEEGEGEDNMHGQIEEADGKRVTQSSIKTTTIPANRPRTSEQPRVSRNVQTSWLASRRGCRQMHPDDALVPDPSTPWHGLSIGSARERRQVAATTVGVNQIRWTAKETDLPLRAASGTPSSSSLLMASPSWGLTIRREEDDNNPSVQQGELGGDEGRVVREDDENQSLHQGRRRSRGEGGGGREDDGAASVRSTAPLGRRRREEASGVQQGQPRGERRTMREDGDNASLSQGQWGGERRAVREDHGSPSPGQGLSKGKGRGRREDEDNPSLQQGEGKGKERGVREYDEDPNLQELKERGRGKEWGRRNEKRYGWYGGDWRAVNTMLNSEETGTAVPTEQHNVVPDGTEGGSAHIDPRASSSSSTFSSTIKDFHNNFF
ncbi:MAG: hypothetical protein M1823_001281 [Watsoniomyces obsoletus]|nr:MAG: hypothetical protein M1823_001281 [Watsoniomyces obsoletus]